MINPPPIEYVSPCRLVTKETEERHFEEQKYQENSRDANFVYGQIALARAQPSSLALRYVTRITHNRTNDNYDLWKKLNPTQS